MKTIELALERLWRSALIPFREILKVFSTYTKDMLPIKRGMFITPSFIFIYSLFIVNLQVMK